MIASVMHANKMDFFWIVRNGHKRREIREDLLTRDSVRDYMYEKGASLENCDVNSRHCIWNRM